MKTTRRVMLPALAVIGLLLAVGWTWTQLLDVQGTAASAVRNTQDVERLAGSIERLRQQGGQTALVSTGTRDPSQMIEAAAKHAGLEAGAIFRIEPQKPARIEKTAYQDVLTRLELRSITLRQLVTFLHKLDQSPNSLVCRSLRLDAPAGADGGDHWRAEVTVGYLIYSPERAGSPR